MPILIFSLISSTSAAPEITVNNETFDFGFVPQKAKLSHTFWISSSGTDVLKILKVVPGCANHHAVFLRQDLKQLVGGVDLSTLILRGRDEDQDSNEQRDNTGQQCFPIVA